jgi:hypothetical protein
VKQAAAEWSGWSPQKALADMDHHGVASAILSYTTPGVWLGNVQQSRSLHWDAGFVVSIGDTLYGSAQASETFAADELSAAAEWLDQKARELYPKSDCAGKP